MGLGVDSGGKVEVSDFRSKIEILKNQFLRQRVDMAELEAY